MRTAATLAVTLICANAAMPACGAAARAASPEAQPGAVLQLRGAESAVAPVVEDSAHEPGRPAQGKHDGPAPRVSLRKVMPSAGATPNAHAQTSHAAEPTSSDNTPVDAVEAPNVWDGEVGAANVPVPASRSASPSSVTHVDFLRGRSGDSSGPDSTDTLRNSAFGDIGKDMYKVPNADGRIALNGAALQAVRPLTRHQKSPRIPITEISLTAMALLTFILGRSFLRAMRREKARRARAG